MYFQRMSSYTGKAYQSIKLMLNMKGLKSMTKEKILNVRVTPQQYEKIQQSAASSSMKISEFARHMMTTDTSSYTLYDKQHVMEILSDISNIANNICEILGEDYPEICDSLEEGVSEICRILN